MTKHNDRPSQNGNVCVLHEQQHVASTKEAIRERQIDVYDATVHVGLRTVVCNAAIEIERVDQAREKRQSSYRSSANSRARPRLSCAVSCLTNYRDGRSRLCVR